MTEREKRVAHTTVSQSRQLPSRRVQQLNAVATLTSVLTHGISITLMVVHDTDNPRKAEVAQPRDERYQIARRADSDVWCSGERSRHIDKYIVIWIRRMSISLDSRARKGQKPGTKRLQVQVQLVTMSSEALTCCIFGKVPKFEHHHADTVAHRDIQSVYDQSIHCNASGSDI